MKNKLGEASGLNRCDGVMVVCTSQVGKTDFILLDGGMLTKCAHHIVHYKSTRVPCCCYQLNVYFYRIGISKLFLLRISQ